MSRRRPKLNQERTQQHFLTMKHRYERLVKVEYIRGHLVRLQLQR